jgi:hypothetical protein
MATKTKATTNPSPLKAVRRQPSPLEELRAHSLDLSNIGIRVGHGTMNAVLEEIMRALAPLRYLKEASIEYQEDLNEFVVNGYLSLFLAHMDHILLFYAQNLVGQIDQKEQTA